jgi:hypothetical protein
MVTAAHVRTLALSFPEVEASQCFDQPDEVALHSAAAAVRAPHARVVNRLVLQASRTRRSPRSHHSRLRTGLKILVSAVRFPVPGHWFTAP